MSATPKLLLRAARGVCRLLVVLLLSARSAQAQTVPTRPDSALRSVSELMGSPATDSVVTLPTVFQPAHAPAPAPGLADFRYTDSLLTTLAARYQWAALDSAGRAALRLGTDYPGLHRRLGQAALARERPAEAVRQYGLAYRANPVDTLARYGLALAYLEMNQPPPAALLARDLPDSLRHPLHLDGFRALTQIEVEGSAQFPNTMRRGTSGFGRLGLSSRLGPRLSLTQNLSYFGQRIDLPDDDHRGGSRPYAIRQNQYHALLGVQLAPRWRALVGYHFLDSDLGRRQTADGHLGYAALAYARPYWTAQVGFFAGTLTDTTRYQADLRLTVYPLGSLRLYGFGRASVVRSAGRSFPNGLLGVGGRLHHSVWLEAYGGLGQVPVLAELDGTYVYNLLDPLRARGGASLLILLPQQLSWRLTAGTERRRDAVDGTFYSLFSLSTTLTWTW
jgi:tetratricopeptide (TPR) repeat protein